MPMKWKVEDLADAVANAYSITDVVRNLGLGVAGGNHQTVKVYIKNLGLDTSHFSPSVARKRVVGKYVERIGFAEHEIFVENWSGSQNVVRRKARKTFPQVCTECKIGSEWNAKPLVLQLDHINGNRKDCRKENLRFLCPNCHSQTPTFAGRSSFIGVDTSKKIVVDRKRKITIWNTCIDCETNIIRKSTRCRPCRMKFQRIFVPRKTKIQWPSVEQVHKDVLLLGYRGVGNNLGVSDAAVKKFLKKNGINIPRYHTQNNLELCWKK